MSDESKTPSSGIPSFSGLDDPNLSQEDRDLRLALALQQQENTAAYDAHKERHDANVAAATNRTSRTARSGKAAFHRTRGKN
mmetsp:Transcript_47023/g.99928  ORF Transcript_47023/g.99928 Transcript_47023/m.99928 type:complete len:82 (-) Transcript_47023:385-630(-)